MLPGVPGLANSLYFTVLMHTITDQSGNQTAILYSNAILQLPDLVPVGIVLGNSLYGLYAQSCGRIFKGFIRNGAGEILGRLEKNEDLSVSYLVIQKCMQLAWKIIAHMQGDGCLWVEEKPQWSKQSLIELLTHSQAMPQVEHVLQPASPVLHTAAR